MAAKWQWCDVSDLMNEMEESIGISSLQNTLAAFILLNLTT